VTNILRPTFGANGHRFVDATINCTHGRELAKEAKATSLSRRETCEARRNLLPLRLTRSRVYRPSSSESERERGEPRHGRGWYDRSE
jgi:hypothetical protein